MAEATGIDIGGTFIKAVRIDAAGRVLQQRSMPTAQDVAGLSSAVRGLVSELGPGPVGVASPGVVGPEHTHVTWMRGRLEALEGLAWSEVLGRPTRVLNDAHAATIAEAWIGAAAGLRHVVMLTLGTGVGGGVIVDGKLLAGATGRAGALGHLCIDLDGPMDIVNTPGSVEHHVGNYRVAERTGYASTALLLEAVAAGNPEAQQHWQRTLHALACGLVSILNAFDPEAVILGGGIAQAGERHLLAPLRAELDRFEWRPLGRGVTLTTARLGDIAGAIGAARFATLEP